MAGDYIKLQEMIVSNSVAADWDTITGEWFISGFKLDTSRKTKCLCGKCNIKYVYRMTNRVTRQSLFPIGSTCIKHTFVGMADEVNVLNQLLKLKQARLDEEYISFTGTYFSKHLLDYFKHKDIINVDEHAFLVDMFHRKNALTERQQKYVNYLIYYKILKWVDSL